MTPYAWAQLFQTIVMGVVAALVALLFRAFKLGQWAASIDYGPAIKALEARLDKAGAEMSRLASQIQGLPAVLRADFVSTEVAHQRLQETRDERDRIRTEITSIWEELRRQRSP